MSCQIDGLNYYRYINISIMGFGSVQLLPFQIPAEKWISFFNKNLKNYLFSRGTYLIKAHPLLLQNLHFILRTFMSIDSCPLNWLNIEQRWILYDVWRSEIRFFFCFFVFPWLLCLCRSLKLVSVIVPCWILYRSLWLEFAHL